MEIISTAFCFKELHFNVQLKRNNVTGRKGKFGIQQSTFI